MPRRKQPDRDRFAHSPFKTLKGLPVSGAARPPLPAPAPPVPAAPAETDECGLFAREMDWLAVRPLAGTADPPPPAAATDVVAPPAEESGAAEFLAAVGRLDKTFKDELPALDHPRAARPRRLKQLERGGLRPAGELDLHGLTRDEALPRARAFLAHAARQRWPLVLIVTGKGLHSQEGPVLRRALERLLDDAGDLVLEWGEAPRRFGGAGALAVFLRTASPGEAG